MRNRPYPVLKCSSFSPIGERETRSANRVAANDNGDNGAVPGAEWSVAVVGNSFYCRFLASLPRLGRELSTLHAKRIDPSHSKPHNNQGHSRRHINRDVCGQSSPPCESSLGPRPPPRGDPRARLQSRRRRLAGSAPLPLRLVARRPPLRLGVTAARAEHRRHR